MGALLVAWRPVLEDRPLAIEGEGDPPRPAWSRKAELGPDLAEAAVLRLSDIAAAVSSSLKGQMRETRAHCQRACLRVDRHVGSYEPSGDT